MEENKALTLVDLFNYRGNKLRHVIDEKGDPWWTASDVCAILEITDVKQAMNRLDDDERGRYIVHTPGGNQSMACINESGLYHLIFTSRKAEAKMFRRKVTDEILPSIRKTGSYSIHKIPSRTIHSTSNRFLIEPANTQQLILDYVTRLQNPTARDLSRYLKRFTVKELRQWLHDLADQGLLAEWFTGHSYRYKIAPQKKLLKEAPAVYQIA